NVRYELLCRYASSLKEWALVEALFYAFIQAWLLGLVALVIGRYFARAPSKLPTTFDRKLYVYLQVWAVTFFAQLTFGYLGHVMAWEPHYQQGFAEFLLPLIAGAYFAKRLLVRR